MAILHIRHKYTYSILKTTKSTVRSASKPYTKTTSVLNLTCHKVEVNTVHWHSEPAKSSDLWSVKQQQSFGNPFVYT